MDQGFCFFNGKHQITAAVLEYRGLVDKQKSAKPPHAIFPFKKWGFCSRIQSWRTIIRRSTILRPFGKSSQELLNLGPVEY
jgi:hypothetical protein